MDVLGKTMIFRNDKNDRTFYNAGISNKKQDGTYENGYIQVKFKKGVEVENKTKIDITKGFLSFYKNKDNHDVPFIFVLEFNADAPKQEGEYEEISDDDDLPF